MRRCFSLVGVLAVALCAASPARAVPTMSKLTDVILGSPTIVIAKVHGSSSAGYELDVERALRGTASGALLTKIAAYTSVPFPVGTRVVAFLGPGNTWHSSALLAAGPSLEDGALHVEGLPACCDAQVVMPGVLTLAQLEDAIRGVPLTWTFRGNLVLPGPAGPTPTSIDLIATSSNSVTGMPTMAGFPAPTVLVGGFSDRDVTVTWNTTASRPLRLAGVATGKNPDGSIAVTYRLDEPRALTEAEFRRYVGDATLAYPYYVTEVALSDGTKMTVTLGKDVGRVGELATSKGKFSLSGLSMAPSRNLTAGPGTITLDPRRAGLTLQRTGAEGELVQELMVAPIGCTWATGSGVSMTCKLSLVATRFAAR